MPFNPIEHRMCFVHPERTAPSAWTQHVPVAMLLIDLLQPSTFVELGTYLGTSYCAFCQAVKELNISCRCYGVDNWKGDEHGGFYAPGILADLKQHHDPRYSSFSQLIQAQFDDALPQFTDGSIDLLHIDGYHTYEAVSHDFTGWLPKMSRSGVVVLHDIAEHMGDFGVWRLWDELKARYPQHIELFHGHGLGVVAVGEVVPDGFRELVEVPASQWPALRDLFSELGSRIESQQDVHSLHEQMEAHQRESQEQIERLQQLAEQAERDRARHDQQSAVQSRQYEAALAAARNRQAETENRLASALWQLKWLESSKGVRAVKLARASRAVLRQKGPFALAKRGLLWTIGKRGYHLRDIDGPKASAAPAKVTHASSSAGVREQRLPTHDATFTGASIVIPVFNALDDAKNCVESIYRVGADLPFEVIVIDNGSRPDVLKWLQTASQQYERFGYISLTENLGFSKAINIGLDHARGDYIVLHNSDTVVTTGWLDRLVTALQRDPQLGVVSPMTNYVGNGPQIAEGARLLPVEQAENYAASIAHREGVQYIADRLVFFCVVIPRRVTTMLGGLSGAYGLGNFEDDDYCVRALTAGYKLGIVSNAFVYHHGSKTFQANKIDHDGILDTNRIIFLSRTSRLSSAPLPALWQTKVQGEPAVSVVLRTKDRVATLRMALTSLANQTLNRFEVIVVNDGGEDVSSVLASFEHRLSIHYVRHETPRGAAAALNSGLNAARGEWMAYLDDDDIVYPYHLNALWSTLMQTGARFSYADYTRVLVKTDAAGSPTPMLWKPIPTWEFNLSDLYTQDYLPIHTWMHSRTDAIELGGFREDLDVHEDWDLLLRLAQRGDFVPTRQVSAEYRFYVNSISNSIIQRRTRSLELLEVMYERYPAPEPSETVVESRDMVRQVIRQQITEIDKIQQLVKRGKLAQDEATRRMVATVSGMRVE